MASSEEATKVLCSLCNKAKGIYRCEGCSQVFCSKHSIDHRTTLNKQLEEITMSHDLIYQTLNQQIEDSFKHSLLQKINLWEKKSIDLIQTKAEQLRQELLNDANQDIIHIKQNLKLLSNQLREGREENDFSEIDLRQWTEKLEQLKIELLDPTNVIIEEDSLSLINNIRIIRSDRLDVFERVDGGDARIEDDGRVIVKHSMSHTEIRGKCEYNAGKRTLCFRIEQLVQGGWIFFGIISKTQTMQNVSYSSPSAYGWSNQNQTYVSGTNTKQQTLGIIQNDIILLTIDCDQRKIQLTNRRLNHSIELSVDIGKCPFPWQFHLNLFSPNTFVRILNLSD